MSGSELLVKPITYDPFIPLGTIISWFGLISLELLLLVLTNNVLEKAGLFNKLLGLMAVTLLVLAVLWAPVSYVLSGNFAFNFSEPNPLGDHLLASKIFWYFTYFMAGAAMVGFVIVAFLILNKSVSGKK